MGLEVTPVTTTAIVEAMRSLKSLQHLTIESDTKNTSPNDLPIHAAPVLICMQNVMSLNIGMHVPEPSVLAASLVKLKHLRETDSVC